MKTYKINGEWIGRTAGGCINHISWRFNPQVFLRVKERKVVKIKLVQQNDAKPYHIGFYVAKADSSVGVRRQLSLTRDQLLAKAGFEAKKEVTCELTLEAGEEYFMVPCTFAPRDEGKFSCFFTVDGELAIRLLTPESEWSVVEEAGEWLGRTAGGCRNHASCAANPQFLVKVKQQTDITAVLYQGQSQPPRSPNAPDQIGFYLFKAKDKKLKLDKLVSADFVAKSSFSSTREALAKFTLHPSALYALVPSTFDPGREGPFSLVLFSDAPVKISELSDRAVLSVRGEWKGPTAGGAPPVHTWRNNPQYFLLPTRSVTCTITLTLRDPIPAPVCLYLTRSAAAQAAGHRMLQLRSEDIVAKVGPDAARRSVTLEVSLERSATPYVLVPCLNAPGVDGEFQVTLEAREGEAVREALHVVPCNYQWKQAAMRGKWLPGDLPLAAQPQYALKVERPATVVTVLAPLQREGLGRVGLAMYRVADKAQLKDERDAELIDRAAAPTAPHELLIARDLAPGYYTLVATGDAPEPCPFDLIVYATDDVSLDLAGSRLLPRLPPSAPASAPVSVPKTAAASVAAANTNAPASTPPGQDISRWLLEITDMDLHEKIGQGAYGAVFRATLRSREGGAREVAVKKLSFRDEDEAGEQRKEVLLMSRFTHPNIVQFLGACVDGHELHIVTEFCGRGNLSHCLAEDHQVLTNKGFKFLHEIENYKADDLKFAGYNERDDCIVYETPDDFITRGSPPEGHEMVEFTHAAEAARWDAIGMAAPGAPPPAGEPHCNSNRLSLLVTKGHDMYVKTGKYTTDSRITWDRHMETQPNGKELCVQSPFDKVKADKLVDKDAIKFKSLAAGGLVNANPHRVRLAVLNTDEKHTIFLNLFGFWTGDGMLRFIQEKKPWHVAFKQVKLCDVSFITEACERLGIRHQVGDPDSAGARWICVMEPEIVAFFNKEYAHKYMAAGGGHGAAVRAAIAATASMADDDNDDDDNDDDDTDAGGAAPLGATAAPLGVGVSMNEGIKSAKWFPPWVFELSKEDMRAVLNGLERADGLWAGLKGGEGTIWTSSMRFRDQIVHLAILAGYSAIITKKYDKDAIRGTDRNGRQMVATVARWEVHFAEGSTTQASNGYVEPVLNCKRDVKRVSYHGRVWCITMPSGFLITRRARANDKGQVVIASRSVIIGNCLKAQPEMDWTTKLRLACDAARGMEYLHGHRPPIVHRDLKSLNLLVDRDWNCFPVSDHQLLTSEGWMFYKDVKERMTGVARKPLLFASYDVSAKALVYEKPLALVYNPPGMRDFVEFSDAAEAKRWSADADKYGRCKKDDSSKDHHLSVLATPGHDMYVQEGCARTHDGMNFTWTSENYAKVKAGAIMDGGEHVAVRFLAHAESGIKGPSSLLDVANDDMILPFMPVLGITTEEQVIAFLELYGYWLGDGSMQGSGTTCKMPYVSFESHKYNTWIEEHFKTLGLKKDEDFTYCYSAYELHRYEIKKPAWLGYFAGQYGSKYVLSTCEYFLRATKDETPKAGETQYAVFYDAFQAGKQSSLKPEDIKGVKWCWYWVWRRACNLRRARAILAGLRLADGTAKLTTKAESGIIYTSSARFRDEVQTLALRAGCSSFFCLQRRKGDPTSATTVTANHDQWRVSYAADPLPPTTCKRRGDIKYTSRIDAAWCAIMPSGFVVVRRAFRDADNVVTHASVATIHGNCKIADFGLSKVTSGQTLNSRMGSLNWVAPEILLQNAAYTEYADIYSFGLILWETLTHQLPYAGLSPLQIVKAKDAGDVPPVPPETNKGFAKLIKECCDSKARSRPQFSQVLARLELLLMEAVPVSTTPPVLNK